jgi:hypothetical protein
LNRIFKRGGHNGRHALWVRLWILVEFSTRFRKEVRAKEAGVAVKVSSKNFCKEIYYVQEDLFNEFCFAA